MASMVIATGGSAVPFLRGIENTWSEGDNRFFPGGAPDYLKTNKKGSSVLMEGTLFDGLGPWQTPFKCEDKLARDGGVQSRELTYYPKDAQKGKDLTVTPPGSEPISLKDVKTYKLSFDGSRYTESYTTCSGERLTMKTDIDGTIRNFVHTNRPCGA
jgi:hypothetical protein